MSRDYVIITGLVLALGAEPIIFKFIGALLMFTVIRSQSE